MRLAIDADYRARTLVEHGPRQRGDDWHRSSQVQPTHLPFLAPSIEELEKFNRPGAI